MAVHKVTQSDTIAAINAMSLNPGDSVLFERGGVWAENLVISSSGASGAPIRFSSYGTGPLPVIGTTGDAITANGYNFITVDNIEVADWTKRGIWFQNCSHIVVDSCVVGGGDDNNPTHGIRFNATGANETDNVIRNCTIKTLGTVKNESIFRVGIVLRGQTDAVVRGNEVATDNVIGIWSSSGTNNIIERNHIHHCYGGGVMINELTSPIIRRNTIHHYDGNGIGFPGPATDTIIRGNVIYALGKSPMAWNGIDVNNAPAGGLVTGNVVSDVFRHCFMIDGGSVNWVVEDNIFDASQGAGDGVGDGRIIAIANRDVVGSTGFVENGNLVRPHEDWPYYGSSGQGDGTLYSLQDWRANTGGGEDSLLADPDFVNAAAGDFRRRGRWPRSID